MKSGTKAKVEAGVDECCNGAIAVITAAALCAMEDDIYTGRFVARCCC
jgi:hypothetical protein